MTDSAASAILRQLPGLDRDNRAFWTSGADGHLMIGRCGACATYVHPPLPSCAHCGSMDVKPEPVSGRGRVATFTVNVQRWVPGLPVPYVFAAVELEEQAELYVFTNIVGCEIDAVTAGMTVEVTFEQREDIHLPLFRPVDHDG